MTSRPAPALLLSLVLASSALAASSSAPSGSTLTVVSGSAAELVGGERVCFTLSGAETDTERVRVKLSFVGAVPRGRLVVDGAEGFEFRDPQETFSFSVATQGVHQVTLAVEEPARIDRLLVATERSRIASSPCEAYDEEQRRRLAEPPAAAPEPPAPAPVNALEGAAPAPAAEPAPATELAPAATVPAGTSIALTLQQEISTKTAHAGSTFSARVTDPVVIDGREVLPAGARVTGSVLESKDAGRFGRSTLKLGFDRVTFEDGRSMPLAASLTQLGKGSAKKQGGIIAGSAAGGALLGSVLGGSSEALLGAALGAAIAAGSIAAKPGESVTLPAGSVLTIGLDAPLDVPPPPAAGR